MDPDVKYLLSLGAIRDRASLVGAAARSGQLAHFTLHEDRLDHVADYVTSVIKRDFGPDKYHTIPPHGRWQHFEVAGVPRIDTLLAQWRDGSSSSQACDDMEITRRLIDLFFVSVLLDAGAGDHWRFEEPKGETTQGGVFERSEGIAVASLYMFTRGDFMVGEGGVRVDGKGLEQLTTEKLANGFQVSQQNPMVGVDSRAALLRSFGKSLLAHSSIFGDEGRPGKIVDYMVKTANNTKLDIHVFWDVLQDLLIPVWPKDRTNIKGQPIGDAWPLSVLRQGKPQTEKDGPDRIQPFHKLTQWLTYSLMVPFQRILGLEWINASSMTGLPEYRNGGLFVDLGALTLKPETLARGQKASGQILPQFDAGDDAIVEWRAMTLVLLDAVYEKILERLDGVQLSLVQVLEAGTWKSGREVAKEKRPDTKSSPILIQSDGTVF